MDTTAIGRQIARESILSPDMDSEDVLGEFERGIVGGGSVRLTLPLRNPLECQKHLAMIEAVAANLRKELAKGGKNRSLLFMVRGELRRLDGKLNAYRKTRRD